MSFLGLQRMAQASRSWAWLLDIGGCTTRYWSGQAPPATSITSGWPEASVGEEYVDFEAIVPDSLGTQTAKLDALGGIAAHGAMSVTVASMGVRGGTSDPRAVFGRVSERGATLRARLDQTIPHGVAMLDILADRQVEGVWPDEDGWLHVGQEAFRYDRTDGVTFVDCKRMAARTYPQEHSVSQLHSWIPWVTSEPVAWQGRPARLRAAPRMARALVDEDYSVVCGGIISDSPSLEQDGLSMVITIAPLTTVFARALAPDRAPTHLLNGWHFHRKPIASSISITAEADSGGTVSTVTYAESPVGDPEVFADATTHEETYDPSLPSFHPRHGALIVRMPSYPVMKIAAYTPGPAPFPDAFVTEDDLPATIPQGTHILDPGGFEEMRLDLFDGPPDTEALLQWPADVLGIVNIGPGGGSPTWQELLNKIDSWVPESTQGVTGRWINVALQEASSARPAGLVATAEVGGRYHLHFFRSANADAWAGIDLASPDDETFPALDDDGLPIAIREIVPVALLADGTLVSPIIPIRGFRTAWYQQGEWYILVEDDLFGGAIGTTQFIRVEHTRAGKKRQVDIPITANEAQLDGDGNPIGYRLTIRAAERGRIESFWDEAGERVVITPLAKTAGRSPTRAMLEMLMSGRGLGVNGAYDVLPYGLNLMDADVDIESFERFPVDSALRNWSPVIDATKSFTDNAKPILALLGACVVLRNGSDRPVLALVKAGHETQTESIATIGNGAIAVEGRPRSLVDDRVIRRVTIALNYRSSRTPEDRADSERDEPQDIVNFIDADAIAEAGQNSGEGLKLECRGLRISGGGNTLVSELGNVFVAIRSRVGRPRRVWSVGVPTYVALRLDLGDVITFSAADAVNVDGSLGCVDVAARVIAISHKWGSEGSTLDLVGYGINSAGYVPALKVATVVDTDVVTVEANAYTATEDPITGDAQTDLTWFAEGDVVDCVPAGDWANRNDGGGPRGITDITGNQVTFNADHGLQVGDTIRHAAYDDVSAIVQRHAYLADSSDHLGAGDDPAKEMA